MRRIVRKAGVCGGRPVLEGTRLEPRHIAEYLDGVEGVMIASQEYELSLPELVVMATFYEVTADLSVEELERIDIVDLPMEMLSIK